MLRIRLRNDFQEIMPQSIKGSVKVFVQYYPFKSNGIFIEGAFVRHFNVFNRFSVYRYSFAEFNPGYTIMIGKNRNIALDIKVPIFYYKKDFFIMVLQS